METNAKKIKAVPVIKTHDEDYGGFVECIRETRYVIIDTETGNMLDDAQGYGYKSAQAAYRGWSYKSKPKKTRQAIKNKRKRVRDWIEKNSAFFDGLENDILHAEKSGYDVSRQDFFEMLESASKDILQSMPCTRDELWRYWR